MRRGVSSVDFWRRAFPGLHRVERLMRDKHREQDRERLHRGCQNTPKGRLLLLRMYCVDQPAVCGSKCEPEPEVGAEGCL
jgi:hypothetical protein